MPRPTEFTQGMADRICDGIASGYSLRKLCDEEDMPDKATVFRWLAKHEEFRDQYARAREAQSDALLEEIFEIADQWEDPAKLLRDPDVIQRAKLRIDTRKWAMSKMAPKKYGDRLLQEHVGKDGGAMEINVTIGGHAG